MTSGLADRHLAITCTSITEVNAFSLDVPSGCRVADVVRTARDKLVGFGSTAPPAGRETSSTGPRASADWSLRENRDVEEGKWWTEAEVESYRDRECLA